VAVLFLCFFLIPIVVGSPERLTWALWSLILLAELLALAMHWWPAPRNLIHVL
jgi:hypothetical protein